MAHFLGLLFGKPLTTDSSIEDLEKARDASYRSVMDAPQGDEMEKAQAAWANLNTIIMLRREELRAARISASRAIDPR